MSGKFLWAISLGFLLGVFARSFLSLSWPFALLFLSAGAFTLVLYAWDRRMAFLIFGIVLIACAGGMLRMDAARLVGEPELAARLGTKVTLEGVVVAEPDVRERSVRLNLRAEKILVGSTSIPVRAGTLVVAPPHTPALYGDVVRAEGTLRTPEPFDTGSGRVFNYPMFLAKDGILYQLSFAEVTPLGENRGNIFTKAALSIKSLYLAGLRRVLPEPEAGLAAGITVGDKRSLGEGLSRAFQESSLVHIVVLSGYNMTVVINAAAHVLAFIPRYAQFAVSGGIVALFVLMTGGAASATRAGSMALIATYARLTGRAFIALRVLAVVAFAMVLWNPFILAFDPGFQLSILATVGLILFTPLISSRMTRIPERFGFREILASTLGTQIAVLPLLLYQNGLLSFVAIPANLLALVAVPAAMLASFVAALAGVVFGGFGAAFALPALMLLTYIIAVAERFSSLPLSSMTIPAFGIWVVGVVYICIGIAYLMLKKERPILSDRSFSKPD